MTFNPSPSTSALPVIQVACGVLQRLDGYVLIAQRPAGKLAAGKWEFPGGKLEAGETARAALQRELSEELGVQVIAAEPLARLRQDYTDRRVWLDTWCVTAFDGEPRSLEAQALEWILPSRIGDFDVLPSCWRVAAALCLPTNYVFTPADASITNVLRGLPTLPANCLLRLRLPAVSDEDYARFARQLIPAAHDRAIGIILDRAPEQVLALNADGWHGRASRLRDFSQRPLPHGRWVLASAHDASELAAAHALGADAAVLGPVQATTSHLGAAAMGWASFGELAASGGLPVYALGGVGPAEFSRARASNALGIAGISAYWPRA